MKRQWRLHVDESQNIYLLGNIPGKSSNGDKVYKFGKLVLTGETCLKVEIDRTGGDKIPFNIDEI